MAKIKKIPSGFIAHKSGVVYILKVEEYDLGYYIKITQDDKLLDMTTRNTPEKVISFVAREKARLYKIGGWTIDDFKEINTRGVDITKLKR